MGKRLGLLLAGTFAGTALLVVDCGLDESGIVPGGGDDSAIPTDTGVVDVQDAGQPDVYIPPTCSSIDASCLGAAVPSGWSLLGVASGTVACPPTNFDPPIALVENPRLRTDSCGCSACTTTGTYTCNGFTLKAGGSCAGVSISKTGTGPQCVANSQSGSSAYAGVQPAAPSGTPNCSISPTGTHAVDTDPVTGCRPNNCQADFCGVVNVGLKTCIVHDGVAACPAGFTPRGTTGQVGAAGTATCNTCSCTVNPIACTGTFRVFNSVTDCGGDGGTTNVNYTGSYPADGGCNNVGNFDSIYYVPDPTPPTTCNPAAPAPTTGTPGLTGIKTICCAP